MSQLPADTSILLCTPVRGGISPSYEMSADALAAWCREREIPFAKRRVAEAPVDAARDMLVAEFLKATHSNGQPFKFCLMIDAGVGFSIKAIEHLIAANEDFAAAAVPLRHTHVDKIAERGDPKWGAQFSLAVADSAISPEGGVRVVQKHGAPFIDVVRIGAACLCLKRTVFETIERAWPEIRAQDTTAYFKPALFDANHDTLSRRLLRAVVEMATHGDPQPLVRALDIKPEEVTSCGEDISFVHRWLATGGKVWLLADAAMIHEGHGYWAGNFAALLD